MLLYSKVIHVKKKRKIKTKNFLIFIICILLIIISITYGIKKLETTNKKNDKNSTEEKNTKTNNNKDNSKEEKELTELEKAKKDLDYYIDENTEKYQEYRNKNKDLSIEKVITNVNIGLHDAYYTNTKESKYQNTYKILVNKYNYVTEKYIPENLEAVSSEYSSKSLKLVSYAKEAFQEMAKAAKSEN